MQYSTLSTVQHRVIVGAPLPFNVRDADRTLLLARGRVIESNAQMEALFRRGALVDIAELMSETERIRMAPKEKLPALWTSCMATVTDTLQQSGHESFLMALESSTTPVLALVERDPDLAIFQVLRQDANELTRYGIDHSLHAGITAFLVARRLGWNETDTQRVFKAALTMNISMLELQGHLAVQATPITNEQREAVHAHPWFSRQMLEISGVTDRDWLDAVSQHHESADGAGYPNGLKAVNSIAELIRLADVYAAKLSPRAGRSALAADQAGRAMFMQNPGHPASAALIKEFGAYPPGCFVRLASGETGVVVQRGPTVMTPVVAVLSSASGASLGEPLRRDTSVKGFAVHSVLPSQVDFKGIAREALVALTD